MSRRYAGLASAALTNPVSAALAIPLPCQSGDSQYDTQ